MDETGKVSVTSSGFRARPRRLAWRLASMAVRPREVASLELSALCHDIHCGTMRTNSTHTHSQDATRCEQQYGFCLRDATFGVDAT